MNRDLKSFRQKTIMTIIIQLILISLGMIIIVFLVMEPKVRELENKYVEEHLMRLGASFDLRITKMEQMSYDWSFWDDSYFFMQDDDEEEYINSNISYLTLENLELDMVIYIDRQGQIKYSGELDTETQILKPVDEGIINRINQAQFYDLNKVYKGLIEVNNKAFMFVSQQIKLSDGSGDSVGNLIMGRYVDEELTQTLSQELGINVKQAKYENNLELKANSNNINILGNNEIEGSMIINDINDEPYLVLNIQMQRDVNKIAREGIVRVIVSFLFIHVLFTTMIFLYFEIKILRKMYGYQEKVGKSELKLAELNENLEKSVNEKTRRLKAIVKAIPDVIFKLDKHGTFVDSEVSNVNWMLTSEENFIGKNLKDIMPPEIAKEGLKKLEEAINTKTVTIQEYDLDIDGAKTYFEARFISSNSEDVFAILRNVTELNENKRYIEYLSYHDQLTKIHNRRYYEEEIVKLDCEKNLPLSVAMIDVNGLKLINDTFGHDKGDQLIIKIAGILEINAQEGDLLARIGGDEFMYAFPKTSNDEAELKISKIQQMIGKSSFKNMNMSVSIGIDTKTNQKESFGEILVSAENKMYRKKLIEGQLMRKNTIDGILKNIYDKREVDKEHSINVKDYCMTIGKELEYSSELMDELKKSALFHDIGKVSIDNKLLDMPRLLNTDEFEQVKKHAENGYRLLKAVDSYSSISDNVLSHHEHWDGNGYPRQIKGESIPEMSRIISIAEAYESMISYRPYKDKLTKEQAILELQQYSGTQFDPILVDIFINKCLG